MDYSDETPERYWVRNPRQHMLSSGCVRCGTELNMDGAIPVLALDGPLCIKCAQEEIKDNHPVTVAYLEWVEKGDLRWWSAWHCNEDCCYVR